MKKSLIIIAALVVAGFCLAPSASATTIVTGDIYRLNSSTISVDYWYFNVLSAGTVTMDVLSWERDSIGGTGDVDVNGDGEIAYFDPVIYLFRDDGSLDTGDYITDNDDSSSTFGDGSIFRRDSYLSLGLTVDDYALAISAYWLSQSEAIGGLNYNADYGGPYGPNLTQIDHGDYQITFDGPVYVEDGDDGAYIPEPATLALLGFGLAGLALRLRRKRK